MELFLFHPIRSAAAAMVLRDQFICPPCVFCHHSLQCSWVRRARSLSLHLATQLNIGQRQPSGRGLFTKIHFDLWLRWRIVCCWRRRRRRGQAHTVHRRARAPAYRLQIHGCLKSPARALFDLIPIAICAPRTALALSLWPLSVFICAQLSTHARPCAVGSSKIYYISENHITLALSIKIIITRNKINTFALLPAEYWKPYVWSTLKCFPILVLLQKIEVRYTSTSTTQLKYKQKIIQFLSRLIVNYYEDYNYMRISGFQIQEENIWSTYGVGI
jgi:hypothetical protein